MKLIEEWSAPPHFRFSARDIIAKAGDERLARTSGSRASQSPSLLHRLMLLLGNPSQQLVTAAFSL
jgi:hypothetical protein